MSKRTRVWEIYTEEEKEEKDRERTREQDLKRIRRAEGD